MWIVHRTDIRKGMMGHDGIISLVNGAPVKMAS